MPELILKNIKKYYDTNQQATVENINLEIHDREFIVLVGPSGCGKSTTLRMIAGLEEISEGEFYIDDKLVNHIEPKDRDIAMVFQNYALYPHMNVYNNMAFALKQRKIPKDEIDNRVKNAANILDLTDYLYKKPGALSGGQRQRVALGRAIVRDAKVFLMDEPLSNLDAKLRTHMRAEIIKLHNRLNTTTIYVTHDQTEALTMASRIVVMKSGKIMQVGTPKEIYEKPQNVFVAGFIGSPSMNFLNGNIIEHRLILDNISINKNVQEYNGEVIIGIRPEDIVINTFGEFEGKINVAELLGSEMILYVSCNFKEIIIKVSDNTSYEVGDTIRFNFNSTKIHLFNKYTEERLKEVVII